MAFDGIVAKKIVDELSTLINHKIDKIYQPDKNTIILGLYGNFTNVALLACISSNNYRLHLTAHMIKNPTVALNFCMLLRKHILGYKLKNIYTKSLERIIFIELENSDNPDKPITKKIIVELMGKHSNIVLINENGIIIDAIRHTSTEENAQRDIYPTARYFEPVKTKYNLFEINNFDDFYKKLNLPDENPQNNIKNAISDTYNGISLSSINYIANEIENEKKESYMSSKLYTHRIYDNLMKVLNSKNISIKITSTKNEVPKDYALTLDSSKDYLSDSQGVDKFRLNFLLDDFYFSKESNELFEKYRNTLLNVILTTLKKYEKRLYNIDDKLAECAKMDKYKLYGELITANLYKIPNYNISKIYLENYYDNNNLLEIPLDKKYSPQYNAKRYFKKYTKLKNALEIVSGQKKETLDEIKYIDSIVYELDNCSCLNDVQQVYDEIYENEIFKNVFSHKRSNKPKNTKKPKKMTSNKYVSFNPLKYIIEGYTVYVGRNNKENDYLTNKFASKNDIWFHAKDIHGSHVILKIVDNKNVPKNIIYEAAKLAASHSKAKNSSNVPVDFCLVQFVKKIPGNKPGLVIYRNNKTIYV